MREREARLTCSDTEASPAVSEARRGSSVGVGVAWPYWGRTFLCAAHLSGAACLRACVPAPLQLAE